MISAKNPVTERLEVGSTHRNYLAAIHDVGSPGTRSQGDVFHDDVLFSFDLPFLKRKRAHCFIDPPICPGTPKRIFFNPSTNYFDLLTCHFNPLSRGGAPSGSNVWTKRYNHKLLTEDVRICPTPDLPCSERCAPLRAHEASKAESAAAQENV